MSGTKYIIQSLLNQNYCIGVTQAAARQPLVLSYLQGSGSLLTQWYMDPTTGHITLAADRSRLQIAKETMETSKKAMDLTELLVGGGTSNRGDFWQASTVFQQARGDVAVLTAAIVQDKNALELLAGGPLDDALMPDTLPDQLDWFAEVPVGMSSAVLLEYWSPDRS